MMPALGARVKMPTVEGRHATGTVVEVIVGTTRRRAIVWDGTLTSSHFHGPRVIVGLIDPDGATTDGRSITSDEPEVDPSVSTDNPRCLSHTDQENYRPDHGEGDCNRYWGADNWNDYCEPCRDFYEVKVLRKLYQNPSPEGGAS